MRGRPLLQSFFRFDKLGRSFGCVGGLIIAVAERCLILLPLTKYDISEIMISKQPSQENIYISIGRTFHLTPLILLRGMVLNSILPWWWWKNVWYCKVLKNSVWYCVVLPRVAWYCMVFRCARTGPGKWVIGSFSFLNFLKIWFLPLFVLSACPVGPVASTDEGTLYSKRSSRT